MEHVIIALFQVLLYGTIFVIGMILLMEIAFFTNLIKATQIVRDTTEEIEKAKAKNEERLSHHQEQLQYMFDSYDARVTTLSAGLDESAATVKTLKARNEKVFDLLNGLIEKTSLLANALDSMEHLQDYQGYSDDVSLYLAIVRKEVLFINEKIESLESKSLREEIVRINLVANQIESENAALAQAQERERKARRESNRFRGMEYDR